MGRYDGIVPRRDEEAWLKENASSLSARGRPCITVVNSPSMSSTILIMRSFAEAPPFKGGQIAGNCT